MSVSPAAADVPGRPRWAFLVVVAGLVMMLDQITKFLAVKHLTRAFDIAGAKTFGEQFSAWISEKHLKSVEVGPVPFIDSFWGWRYAENPGAAWSFAATWPDAIRVPFFHVVTLLAIVLIGYYFKKLRDDQVLLRVALALVMGGAVGNLVDRFLRGYVIDFIDWHLNDPTWMTSRHWPTFNIADTGISCGVGLIVLDTLLGMWHARKAQPASASAK